MALNARLRQQDLAARLIAAADRHRDRRAFKTAAFLYGLAFRAAADRDDLLVQRGNMLKDVGRYAAAEAAYGAALAVRPEAADTHLQLGRLLALAGRRSDATEALGRALALDPSLSDARDELERLQSPAPEPSLVPPASVVEEEPAVAEPDAAAEAPPAATEAPVSVDDLLAEADRLRDSRAFAAAADAYARVLERAPDRADIFIQRGNMLKDSGRYDEAAAAYEAAAALAPADPEPFVGLGHLGNVTGKPAAARAAFERALAIEPGRDDARHELVMVGLAEQQEAAYRRRLQSGEQAAIEAAAARLDELQAESKRLRTELRDVLTRAATPVGLFAHYLAAHTIRNRRPPPRAGRSSSWTASVRPSPTSTACSPAGAANPTRPSIFWRWAARPRSARPLRGSPWPTTASKRSSRPTFRSG